MKEDNLMEKLLQLFDKCLSERTEKTKETTSDQSMQIIPRNWGELTNIENSSLFVRQANSHSKRVLNREELLKLSSKSRQFLEQLMQFDIIGEYTIELIINQLLFSESQLVPLQEAKWTVRKTLEENLDDKQIAFIDLILYGNEDEVVCH